MRRVGRDGGLVAGAVAVGLDAAQTPPSVPAAIAVGLGTGSPRYQYRLRERSALAVEPLAISTGRDSGRP